MSEADESCLWHAVLDAEPDDELPSLIYADWLEEHGQSERAELLRIQWALAGSAISPETRYRLRRQEETLFRRHATLWAGQLSRACEKLSEWGSWESFDGWRIDAGPDPRALGGSMSLLYQRGRAIWSLESPLPVLRESFDTLGPQALRDALVIGLSLNHLPEDTLTDFARCSILTHLAELRLESHSLGREILRALGQSDLLRRLHTLRMPNLWLDDAALSELAKARSLQHLREISLHVAYTTAEGVRTLADARSLQGVRRLTLNAASVVQGAFQQWLRLPWLDHVTDWTLSDCILHDIGLASLADREPLPHLRRLSLTQSTVYRDGFRALARTQALPALRELDLSLMHGPDGCLVPLKEGELLERLEVLDLTGNHLVADHVARLLDRPRSQLRWLNLERNWIAAAGAVALADSPMLAQVRRLDLGGNQIGDRGLIALVRSPYVGSLRELSLWDNAISDDGWREFLASPLADQLESLDVASNRLTDHALTLLAHAGRMQQLRRLNLSRNPLGRTAMLALLRDSALDPYIELIFPLNPGCEDPTLLRKFRDRFPACRM